MKVSPILLEKISEAAGKLKALHSDFKCLEIESNGTITVVFNNASPMEDGEFSFGSPTRNILDDLSWFLE